MPHRLPFDPKRPLVAARDFTFMGKAYKLGDPFAPEGADTRLLRRQYEARAVNHGEGTAETEQQAPADLVTMTGPAGGRYTITAPWLAEPEVVRGKVNAEKRLAELKAEGAPLGYIEGGSAVTVEGGEGGWYAVDAPWLDEPVKVQGREAAEAEQRKLHEAGEPDSYKGYTLTAGENGWYAITKDGVEGTDGAEAPVLNVHGEDKAREAVAQLRAGEQPEGTALPAEWTDQPEGGEGGEGAGDGTPTGEPNQAPGEGGEPAEGADAETPPADGQPGTTEESSMPKEGEPNVEGDAPNEPDTNQPNGAEVINDQKAAEPGNARSDTDGDDGDEGDGTDGGDGTTGTVGP